MWTYQSPNELYHYGVKGMKWGVRRYQNKDGSLTSAGKKHYSGNSYKQSDSVSKGQSAISKSKLLSGEVGMSDASVSALAQLGSCALAFGAIYAVNSVQKKFNIKKFNKELDDMRSESDFKTLNNVPKLKKKMSASESMKVVNPGYPSLGTVDNCMLCTTAMALREKGYDVSANTISHGLYSENIDKMWGESGKFQKLKAKNSKQLKSALESQGDGAYGNLQVSWSLGGAHSVFWKNENGELHIYDGQSSKEYNTKSNGDLFPYINTRATKYSRLDNAEPTDFVLAAVTKRTK